MPAWLDRLLDASIVFSFDRTGFARHARDFDPPQPRDLTGRRIVVTGASRGIGLAAATGLAHRGAELVLWGRHAGRTEAAADQVAEATGHRPRVVLADLSDLAAVADTLAELTAEGASVDTLLCNAGAGVSERTLSPQGHEITWASHVLGHALIVATLRRTGQLGPDSRVVFTASGGLYTQALDVSDLAWARRDYDMLVAYANAKRAQLVLVRRWQTAGGADAPRFAAMHPGWADTHAVRTGMPRFHAVTKPILRSPAEGADTLVWLASTAWDWPGGRFWFDRSPAPEHLLSTTQVDRSVEDALLEAVGAALAPFLPAGDPVDRTGPAEPAAASAPA